MIRALVDDLDRIDSHRVDDDDIPIVVVPLGVDPPVRPVFAACITTMTSNSTHSSSEFQIRRVFRFEDTVADPDPNLHPVQYGTCFSTSVIRYRSPTTVRSLETSLDGSRSLDISDPHACREWCGYRLKPRSPTVIGMHDTSTRDWKSPLIRACLRCAAQEADHERIMFRLTRQTWRCCWEDLSVFRTQPARDSMWGL